MNPRPRQLCLRPRFSAPVFSWNALERGRQRRRKPQFRKAVDPPPPRGPDSQILQISGRMQFRRPTQNRPICRQIPAGTSASACLRPRQLSPESGSTLEDPMSPDRRPYRPETPAPAGPPAPASSGSCFRPTSLPKQPTRPKLLKVVGPRYRLSPGTRNSDFQTSRLRGEIAGPPVDMKSVDLRADGLRNVQLRMARKGPRIPDSTFGRDYRQNGRR